MLIYLLLIGEGAKRHFILIKDFNTFMYYYTLHRGRKYFCSYCLQAIKTADVWKSHVKDCFKINGKQKIKILEKGKYAGFKTYERKLKSPFMIYSSFETILVFKDNEK